MAGAGKGSLENGEHDGCMDSGEEEEEEAAKGTAVPSEDPWKAENQAADPSSEGKDIWGTAARSPGCLLHIHNGCVLLQILTVAVHDSSFLRAARLRSSGWDPRTVCCQVKGEAHTHARTHARLNSVPLNSPSTVCLLYPDGRPVETSAGTHVEGI